LPDWAHWRHELFAISYEPVSIVYNTRRLAAARVPNTRRQLLELLRAPDAPLRGRVGSYDVQRSAVGYLFATQDAQLGSIAGALLAALGDNHVRLEERTGCWPTTCSVPMRRRASMPVRRWASCNRRTTRW
jgi:iron(III) transport system substrate-binding protein